MKTLIELYDDRPIENVLATEVFRPDVTVYLCPTAVAQDKRLQKKLREYFIHRGLHTELIFLESSLYSVDKLLRQLQTVTRSYENCMLDITGGTDAALFACGRLCADTDLPVFTYSRRRNCFYNILHAPFADNLPCTVTHQVEDCFLMAGGSMRPGRADSAALDAWADRFEPFFRLFLRYRTRWLKIIQYFQVTSQGEKGQPVLLEAESAPFVKGPRGVRIDAPEDCLRDLEKLGFLRGVEISGDRIRYTFKSHSIRAWLRDVGSVLELYVYKICLDSGLFNDVRLSAVVDWEENNVTNEIDVMAMRGVLPVFISCKTCEVTTQALNELAILRDRFGGYGARAAVVTARYCRAVTRHRASALDIDVIDLDDLKAGRVEAHIRSMLRQE